MIIKKIRSLQDTTLNTSVEVVDLSIGQVVTVKFKNIQSFDEMIRLGVFVEANEDDKEVKIIPVIRPDNFKITSNDINNEKLHGFNIQDEIVKNEVIKITKIKKEDLTNKLPTVGLKQPIK
jgi:hypothetical protein